MNPINKTNPIETLPNSFMIPFKSDKEIDKIFSKHHKHKHTSASEDQEVYPNNCN